MNDANQTRPRAHRRGSPEVDRGARGARRPRPWEGRVTPECGDRRCAKPGQLPAADAQCGLALMPARKMGGGTRARRGKNSRLRCGAPGTLVHAIGPRFPRRDGLAEANTMAEIGDGEPPLFRVPRHRGAARSSASALLTLQFFNVWLFEKMVLQKASLELLDTTLSTCSPIARAAIREGDDLHKPPLQCHHHAPCHPEH